MKGPMPGEEEFRNHSGTVRNMHCTPFNQLPWQAKNNNVVWENSLHAN